MSFKWTPIYSVNVKELDAQHQKIFALINDLSELRNGDVNKKLDEIIKGLDEYAIYHFGTEESYFKKFAYPGAGEHIGAHEKYVEKIDELKNEKDQSKLTLNLLKFLSDWWVNHIQTVDQKYSDFFNEHGLY